MKKFLLLLTGSCSLLLAAAQSNNPYDESGRKIMESVKILEEALVSGAIRDLDEATVAAYSARMPIEQKASLALVSEVTQAVTKSSLEDITQKAALSGKARDMVLDIREKAGKLDGESFRAYLHKMVEVIQSAGLPGEEQALLLTGTAVIYHGTQTTSARMKETYPADPVSAGTFIGLVVGEMICGHPCGVAGAIIGFIVGSIIAK